MKNLNEFTQLEELTVKELKETNGGWVNIEYWLVKGKSGWYKGVFLFMLKSIHQPFVDKKKKISLSSCLLYTSRCV